MNTQTNTASEFARQTLSTLAQRKLAPTPDNYARIYAEISGNASQTTEETTPPAWSALIKTLLSELESNHKGVTPSRKKQGLQTVLSKFASNPNTLYEKLDNLIKSWSAPLLDNNNAIEIDLAEFPNATDNINKEASPANPNEMLSSIAELLAQSLESMLNTQPDLSEEINHFAHQARSIETSEQATELAKKLRPFWIKVELRGGSKARIHEGLIHLLRLLVENIGEMVEDEEWLRGQIAILQDIIRNPIDKGAIADAEQNLRQAITRQGMLKQSMNDAKTTLKGLMTTFIDQLGEITTNTGHYHQRIEGYSQQIESSTNILDLNVLLKDIMQDTHNVHSSTLKSHHDLVEAQHQAEAAETRIRQLEQELATVSKLVHQDQLTGALNRRGLDEAYEREINRAERSHTHLCVALLDIDNFKRLNDTLGHHAGDSALVHLSTCIKEALRPTDFVARYGGEEFVIVLPNIDVAEAAATVERLQRELTKRFFLHDNEKILITFSAGVAQRIEGESKEDVIGRADKAMYQAKKTGKNRVVIAE